MKRIGLRTKIGRLFALQMLIIGLATALGVYLTQNLVVEGLLVREALNGEAEHFWSRYRVDPRHPSPDVDNMRGYLAPNGDLSQVPETLRGEAPGYRRIMFKGRETMLHVSEDRGSRLYLVFEMKQVSDLALYFGVIPLLIVLLLIYSLLFVAYRLAQRAVSPIVALADYLESFDFEKDASLKLDFTPLADRGDAEVAAMIHAVEHFTARLDKFIERERTFTRDAGHELRTPVAVFKGTLDLLERNTDRPKSDLDALRRMRRTVDDMESLLETLLLLAREEELEVPAGATSVNEVVGDQLEALRHLAQQRGNVVRLSETGQLRVRASARVVQILVGNLVRNALSYTENGTVEVTVTDQAVRVRDTGVGMKAEDLEHVFEAFYRADNGHGVKGHGLGLAIVKRLTRQFGWTITVESEPAQGTSVEVHFRSG